MTLYERPDLKYILYHRSKKYIQRRRRIFARAYYCYMYIMLVHIGTRTLQYNRSCDIF